MNQDIVLCILHVPSGQLLDSQGNVIALATRIEPSREMLQAAVKNRHGSAVYRCVSKEGCDVYEAEALEDYQAMMREHTVDLSKSIIDTPSLRDGWGVDGEFEEGRLDGWNNVVTNILDGIPKKIAPKTTVKPTNKGK